MTYALDLVVMVADADAEWAIRTFKQISNS